MLIFFFICKFKKCFVVRIYVFYFIKICVFILIMYIINLICIYDIFLIVFGILLINNMFFDGLFFLLVKLIERYMYVYCCKLWLIYLIIFYLDMNREVMWIFDCGLRC